MPPNLCGGGLADRIGAGYAGLTCIIMELQWYNHFFSSFDNAMYRATVVCMFSKWIVVSLMCLSGVVMFAYYADCDPFSSGKVSTPDQVRDPHHYFLSPTPMGIHISGSRRGGGGGGQTPSPLHFDRLSFVLPRSVSECFKIRVMYSMREHRNS